MKKILLIGLFIVPIFAWSQAYGNYSGTNGSWGVKIEYLGSGQRTFASSYAEHEENVTWGILHRMERLSNDQFGALEYAILLYSVRVGDVYNVFIVSPGHVAYNGYVYIHNIRANGVISYEWRMYTFVR